MAAMSNERLNDAIKDVKERMKIIGVKVDGTATYDRTHKHPCSASRENRENTPVLSLSIPRQIFLNWNQYVTLCKELEKTPDCLTAELNDMSGTLLNHQSTTLNKRINTEFSRFIANYRKMGGAKRKAEASKHTKIIVFRNELKVTKESEVKVLSSS